jgi:glutathione peroxidase
MMHWLLIPVLAFLACLPALAGADPTTMPSTQPSSDGGPLGFTMKSLSGQPVDLSKYKGKVVVMVNTASKCGFTPQYAPLEAVYQKYADRGLVILGFPSNDFGHQEPGTDEEISTFCTKNYGVTFDMFSKVDVKGDDICPLYQFLTSEDTDKDYAGEVKWNFEKFLISRDGKVVARFRSKTRPDSAEFIAAVEAELAKQQ